MVLTFHIDGSVPGGSKLDFCGSALNSCCMIVFALPLLLLLARGGRVNDHNSPKMMLLWCMHKTNSMPLDVRNDDDMMIQEILASVYSWKSLPCRTGIRQDPSVSFVLHNADVYQNLKKFSKKLLH